MFVCEVSVRYVKNSLETGHMQPLQGLCSFGPRIFHVNGCIVDCRPLFVKKSAHLANVVAVNISLRVGIDGLIISYATTLNSK